MVKAVKIIALLVLTLALAAPAAAGLTKAKYSMKEQHRLNLMYDVYAGGFKGLNAALIMDLDKKAYDMTLEAETEGFIGTLFPWKASYNTAGHAEKGMLIPTVYTERSTWRKGVKITEMNYAPDGRVLKTTVQEKGQTTVDRDVNDVLTNNSVDLLTGALVMLQNVKNTRKCDGTFPVFDGKRRYNIHLIDDGVENLPATRYSSFTGEALRCVLQVEPVAGFVKKDAKRGWMAVQSHSEQHRQPPRIWLAPYKDTRQVVPVRMEIASDYGSVVAHLVDKKTD